MQQIHHIIDKLKSHQQAPLVIMALAALFVLTHLMVALSSFELRIGAPLPLKPIPESRLVPIAEFHLFGLYASDYDDLPEMQLQLTLQGTEVSPGNSAESLAIIASPSMQTKAYRVGDYVPGGAVIHAIQAERVILNDNGELERLSMPIPKLKLTPVVPGLPANSGLSPA